MSMPSASMARRMSGRPRSPFDSRTATPRVPAIGSPKRASTARIPPRSASWVGTASTLGRPIVALSSAGVPSATIRPLSMIPTRLASTSASSRYCVVRKTVTPSSCASRPTSFHSALRLCGSSPVVGSSRKRIRGSCTSASARSRRRFIPPEYVRILRSPASVRPTRSRRFWERSARWRRPMAWSAICRFRCSRPVRSGSSAASWSAAPITRRTLGPSRTTSKPPTRAIPALGGSSVVSMCTVVDLPAPFGPRKP